MRKNTRDVCAAWMAGRSHGKPGASIWTDGEAVYSYRTCIAARDTGRLARAVLNRSQYSTTTSSHQGGLAAAMPTWMRVRYVENLPFGARPVDLTRRARVSWRVPGETYPRADCGVEGCDRVRGTNTSACARHSWMVDV